MSITTRRHRADAPAGWQPIGLPIQQSTAAPAAFVRRDPRPGVRRAVRTIAGPAAALTASVAVVTMTAAVPSAQGATPVSALLVGNDSPASATVSTPDVQAPTTQATASTAEAQPTTTVEDPKVPAAKDPQLTADQKGLLPALPNLGDALPNIDGDTTTNTWTPGQTSAAGGASFGTPSTAAPTPGVHTADGDVYPGTTDTGFNSSTTDWSGYQEYSPWCWSRGVTCVNWNFSHEKTGGPAGAGDGFLRVNGTSLGVAPCVPNTGVGRWVSPSFVYNTSNAKGWKIDFDFRTTALVAGDGHATFSVQILDEDGRVVTTAHGPHGVLPTNNWEHFSNGFDGSKLVYGKSYKISIMVDVVHAETALTWGNLDFDNIKMTAVPGEDDGNGAAHDGVGTTSSKAAFTDDLTPYTACRPADEAFDAITELLAARPQDLCPVTNAAGQAAAPLLDVAEQAMSTPSVSNLLDKASGVFAVLDLQTADFVGYAVGKDAMPSVDPRDLVAYVKDGGIGSVGNYALVFVTDTASLVPSVAKNPVPAVSNILTGQLGNATQLLSDPGRLTRIPLDWQVGNVKWMLETILNPVVSKDDRDTEIGGTVWDDADKDGALDKGEQGVPGVKVKLEDRNGNSYGTATTGPDGRYVFTHVTPRTDPSDYYLTFEPDSLPDGASFTTEHAPGTVHGTTSHADPTTGKTDRIRITRYQKDLNWNAGLINVPTDDLGSEPGTATPGTTEGTPSSSNPLSGLLGGDTTGDSGDNSGDDPVGGLLGGLTGQLPLPGGTAPGSDEPGSDQPGSDQPGSDQPGSDQPGSDPVSGLLGGLTGQLPLPGGTTPGSDQPGSDQPGSDQPSQPTDGNPGTSGSPTSPVSGLTTTVTKTVSGLTSSLPQVPADPTQLVGTLTGALGGVTGQSTQPGSDQPTGDQPSTGDTGDQPGTGEQQPEDQVTFTVGAPAVNDTTANAAPGPVVPAGSQIVVTVPVKNTGSTPITDVKAQVPGQDGLTDLTCSTAAIQPGQTATCRVTLSATSGNVSMPLNIIGTNADGEQMTKLCRIHYVGQEGHGQIGLTGKFTVNGKPVGLGTQTQLPSGESTLQIQVTNTGSARLTTVSAQSQTGSVTCDKTSLAPGETATCSITFTPQQGGNSFKVDFTGQDAIGMRSTATFTFSYTYAVSTSASTASH